MADTRAKAPAKPKGDRRGCPKGKATGVGIGKNGAGKVGNPAFVATKEQRLSVEYLGACGQTHSMIAEELDISVDTLERHFKDELKEGAARATARLGGVLYEGAKSGDTKKLEMWFDRRGGPDWQKKTGVELSGPGGAALVVTINGADARL